MAELDFSGMTLSQIQALIDAANAEYHERYYERQTEVEQIRNTIAQTIAEIETLLGPETEEPGVDTIRGVRNYTGVEMAANAEIALPLAFEGLDILTQTVLKLAKVVASQTDRPV